MTGPDKNNPRTAAVRISLNPGTSPIILLAAAVERKIRAGAGLISVKHFLWPDFRMLPAEFHPGGRAMTQAFVRIDSDSRSDGIKRDKIKELDTLGTHF